MLVSLFLALVCAGVSALLSAALFLCLSKWGAVEFLQVRGPQLISKIANCEFCFSFWLNVFITLILCIFVGLDKALFLVPFMAAPLTKKFL